MTPKEITVQKELLLNIGNFSNIKIIASVTTTEDNFQEAWDKVNTQILEQEGLEKSLRLQPKAPTPSKGDWKPASDLPF